MAKSDIIYKVLKFNELVEWGNRGSLYMFQCISP